MKLTSIPILFSFFSIFPGLIYAEKLSGTPIASNESMAMAAFDGDNNTSYNSNKPSYEWVGLDLGEPHVISEVKWQASASINDIHLGIFQGANNPDFSDAIPLAIIDDVTIDKKSVDCSKGFRYVRYTGPADSFCRIAEIEFHGVKGEGDDSHLWQLTNLPTVIVNTVNNEIPYDKEHDILSTVIIISKDGTEILQQSETKIRERGNASREFPKKPWRIKFDKKQKVLDAPAKAKKWTLINNYGDKTLMRNMLAFDIAKKFEMDWVPFCQPVDVILNGEYKGCYQLCDQVEVNDNRVNVEEMDSDDIDGENLTGGYLLEVDAYAYYEPVWFESSYYHMPVTIKSPEDDVIVDIQYKYIKDYFNSLERKMIETDNSYREILDTRSFIKHMLVNEIAGNTDTYWSTYMYKHRGDPMIYTGPVWDFDLGFNNDYRSFPVSISSGNTYLWNTNCASSANGMNYFARKVLLHDSETAKEIADIWEETKGNGFSIEWLTEKVDEYEELLYDSQRLNFMRWNILNTPVHMNPAAYGSFENECEVIKEYIRQQIPHLESVILNIEPDNAVPGLFEDEELEKEYFTLNGIRVSKPVKPGIYIERSGNVTRKLLIPGTI